MKHPHLLLILLLVATSASAQLPNGVTVWHDDDRRVTCWVLWSYNRGGISCLPDSQVVNPPAPAAEPLQNRAAPAANEPQDGVNPASTPTPRRHREVFQL